MLVGHNSQIHDFTVVVDTIRLPEVNSRFFFKLSVFACFDSYGLLCDGFSVEEGRGWVAFFASINNCMVFNDEATFCRSLTSICLYWTE